MCLPSPLSQKLFEAISEFLVQNCPFIDGVKLALKAEVDLPACVSFSCFMLEP